MNYTVRHIAGSYVVIKNRDRVYATSSYEFLVRFLKDEMRKMNKLGLKFKLNTTGCIEEDVYSYTY